jgi:hypothetical protein
VTYNLATVQRALVCLMIVALCTLACATRKPADAPQRPIEAVVVEYVRLAAALGARDVDSLDYAYAPPEWTADDSRTPPPLAAIRARALAAAERLVRLGELDQAEDSRRRSLAAQLQALAFRADLLAGRRTSFDDESRALFGVTVTPPDAEAVRAAYAELDRLMPGRGSLPARYESFERRQLVPEDRVRAVFERALAACRDRTPVDVRLPAGEGVEVAYVHDTPWNAYSRYHGHFRSTIQVNVDYGFSVDGALGLACHEGYPGHHVQNVLTEQRLVMDQHLPEFMVQPLFSRQSLLSEALAVRAIDLAFPDDTRATFERDTLYPAAGLDPANAARGVAIARAIDRLRLVVADIARSYLDGDLEFVRAGAALNDRALIPQPLSLLKFFNQFRSYAVTYTYGPDWLNVRDPRTDDPRTSLLRTLLSPKNQPATKLRIR